MKFERDVWDTALTFLVTITIAGAAFVGCGAGELALKDQLAACVTKYNTRPEIDACRAGVESRWFPDAGEGGAK
jgi:hypothetical protein